MAALPPRNPKCCSHNIRILSDFTADVASTGQHLCGHPSRCACRVRGPNKSLVHPRGAVGVVTRTPAGDEEHFLVRFPDGFEKSLTRAQLEVLKHFKDRLGRYGACTPSAPPRLRPRAAIIYRCVMGSQAYGLETEESDIDRRGIYLAPAELQWSLFGAPEQFEDNAAQACYWELQKFLVMALRANPNILECLYSPMVEKTTPLAEELLSIRQGFLSQMIFQTFNGYALSQFKKIEQDLRNQGEVRWKHAMHLLRLLITGAATLRKRGARTRRGAPRPVTRRQTWRQCPGPKWTPGAGNCTAISSARWLKQTTRAPRLRSGESLPHQSAP